MKLSHKIVFVIVSTFITLVLIVAVTSDIILRHNFSDLEKKVLKDNVSKVYNKIEETFPELDSSAKNYVDQFLQGGSEQSSNLEAKSFTRHRIDFNVCYSRTGELIATREADSHGRRHVELTDSQLRDLRQAILYSIDQSGYKQRYGFITMGRNVAQIAIRPYDNGRVIVVGKYVDTEEVKRVSALTKLDIEVSPVNMGGQPEDFSRAQTSLLDGVPFHFAVVDEGHISGYTLFKDIYDKPVLLLKITEQRLIFEQGKASIAYIFFVLIISAIILCGVMLQIIRCTVFKRLETLNANVKDISSNHAISRRFDIHGEDEIENLAELIKALFDSLGSSEQLLKECGERYRALFECAPDAILVIGMDGDEKGLVVAANQAAAEQHGYTVEEICGMKISDLNAPETNAIASEMMKDISGGAWVTREAWHIKKDGTHFPIEIHAGPFRILERNYILGFGRDITSRKLAEENELNYREQIHALKAELGHQAIGLELANRELETFNYSVSHDMRGPLTRISGYCQLMLDDDSGVDAQIRTYVTKIYESSGRLNEMIDAMLNLAQLSTVDFSPELVDLTAICQKHLDSLIQADQERAIEVTLAPNVMVIGDESLLKILMTNLINNAWKFSSRTGQARIEFGVMPDGPNPVYFVRDNGIGFDMMHVDRLFRVFTRLHAPTQFSGSGIGLAMVHRIITRHGGRIWGEGEVGRGATFYFTLAPEIRLG